jgi:hypothetical protein
MFVRSAAVAASCALAFALAACASMVESAPVAFTAATHAPALELRLERSAEVRLSTGYTRVLPTGSRWRHVGKVPKGDVYRPVDAVFSIEGRHIHEAYLVLSDRSLVGFYLPGESGYSPLSTPVPLPFGDPR